MQNPIIWIDAKLLAVTGKFAKWFNWWTGLDNFFQAWQFTGFIAFCYLCGGMLLCTGFLGTLASSILTLLVCPVLLVIIVGAKLENEEIVLSTTQSIDNDRERFICRIASLIFFYGAAHEAIKDTLENHRYAPNGLCILGSASVVIVCYLISIDHPPFQRSQAWRWLREKFNPHNLQSASSPSST